MSDSAPTTAFWFRLGYALENARQKLSPKTLASEAVERVRATPAASKPRTPSPKAGGRGGVTPDPVLDFTVGWVARTVASRLASRRAPGRFALFRAALAGAGAELASVAVHTALVGPPRADEPEDTDALGTLVGGAAEGLVYASLVRPILPGPMWARGAAFGVARYFAARGGGLPQVLGPLSPHRSVPLLDSVVTPRRPGDDTLAEHVVAGLTLAFLYESSALSNGITPDGSD